MIRLLIHEALAGGRELHLSEAQSRQVSAVMRLDVGDKLSVFNAHDGEWRARVSAKSKRGIVVQVKEFLRAARPVPDLELLFAPVKRHATDLIVEKATELGVRRIRPVITQRTIAETVRLDRLQSIAREAAEQTERFEAPEICEPLALHRALDGWDVSRPLIFCDEAGKAEGILCALQNTRPSPLAGEGREGGAGANITEHGACTPTSLSSPQGGGEAPYPAKLALLIGPEGGFTREERAMLRACVFVMPVSLGPRILRAETAVIAALTIIQAAWGDWRQGNGLR